MAEVLVVDDDKAVRDMIVQMLAREGLSATGAEDGRAASEKVAESRFDLVVMDIVMPEKEGLETIRYVRETLPEAPVIAVSGGARIQPEPYLRMAKEFGARYVFEKPLDRTEFIQAVKESLGRER